MKVAIVTGAASGIGRATAERLATAGYQVGMSDVAEVKLNEAVGDIVAKGFEAAAVAADVASATDCDTLIGEVVSRWGRLDVLVANAGVQIGGSIGDTSSDDWQRILDVNLNGAAFCCRAAIPEIQKAGGGSIVIVSSVNAIIGSRAMTVYDMSKAATLGLMRSLATEYGRDGIRVNAICPGNTITDHHIDSMADKGYSPDDIRSMMSDYGLLGRAAEPEEIANAINFLASKESSFITGHALVVDGGYSVTGHG